MPWDRHKVRNCPVTQALGLLHGTAEQQAVSPSSGGPATPQTLGSAQPGASGHVAVPSESQGWPPGSDLSPWEGWRNQQADKGLLWVLCNTFALLYPGQSWQRQDGE